MHEAVVLPISAGRGDLDARRLLLAQVRPPVVHRFGCGPLQAGEAPPGVRVFKHRLLQHFMLSLFCKLPVQPMTRIADMRAAFMARACTCLLITA